MSRDLHEHYDKLSPEEQIWVDDQFKAMFKEARHIRVALAGDDRAEVAVDAVAKWILESKGGDHA